MPRITKSCVDCGSKHTFDVTQKQLEEVSKPREERKHIQDIFPEMSPGDRELFISGICDPCFKELFPPEEDEEE